ncbi:MAG: hypothetical protein JXL80_03000 [Planctomycetes bacterium]|nr:hypothetical protein [Planctomycetota bacterium]
MTQTQHTAKTDQRVRGLRRALLMLLAIVVLAAAIAPSLIPSGVLSDMVRENLEASLGRKVAVSDCSVGWFSGVTVGQLRVASAAGNLDEPSIAIRGLHLKYQPWELVAAARSEQPNLGRAVIEWLGVRVVRQEAGDLDILESSGPPPDFQSLEIRNGMIYLLDRQADTRRYVSQLRLTLGRLARSEKAYVTGSGLLHFPAEGEAEPPADGPAAPRPATPDAGGLTPVGVLSIAGFLDHFDLNNFAGIVGGCDIEWKAINLGYFFPHGSASPGGLRIDAPTSGEMNLAIDEADRIQIRGRVSASQVQLGAAGQAAALDMSHLTVGFAGSYNKATGDIQISPIQVSGAGSSLRVNGDLVRKSDGRLQGKLDVEGMISWAPLKQDVPPLGGVLSRLAASTGTASVNDMKLTFEDDSVHVAVGEVSLDRTELEWKPYLVKPAGRRARLALDATVNLKTRAVRLSRAALRIGQAGQGDNSDEIVLTANSVRTEQQEDAVPTATDKAESVRVEVTVPDISLLPRHVPAAEELIRRFNTSGGLALEVSLWPQGDDLAVALTLDAQGLSFQTGPETGKATGVPLRVRADGLLRGGTGEPECHGLDAVLADSRLTYKGSVCHPAATAERPARVEFNGRLDVTGVQQWLRLVRPYVSRHLSPALVGNLQCELDGHADDRQWQLDFQADASRASVELSGRSDPQEEEDNRLLVKPLGDDASLRLTVGYQADTDTATIRNVEARFADSVVRLSGTVGGLTELMQSQTQNQARPVKLNLDVKSENAQAMLACLPSLQSQLKEYQVDGGLVARGALAVDEQAKLTVFVDLTDTAYVAGGRLAKARGLKQVLELNVSCPCKASGNLRQWTIEKLSASLGPTQATLSGTVKVDRDALRGPEDWMSLRHAVRAVDLAGSATLVQDDSLRAFSRTWNRLSAQYDIGGRASAELHVSGTRNVGELRLTVDATEATFQYGQRARAAEGQAVGPLVFGEATRKPVGTRAFVDLAIRRATMAGEFDVEKATFDVADTHVTCKGILYCRNRLPLRADDIIGYVLDLQGESAQLARLAHLVPLRGLRQLDPQGGVSFSLSVAGDPYNLELNRGDFTFDKARLVYRGSPVTVNGHLLLGRQRLMADALAVTIGDTSLVFAADIADPFETPKGRLAVTGEMLDLDKLMAFFGIEAPDASKPLIGIPPDWPTQAAFLSRMDIAGELAFGEFKWTDDKKLKYDWNAFAADFTLNKGWFEVQPFKAVMFGGVVIGHIATDFREANPELLVEYRTRNLQAGPGLNAMVKLQFPDMTVRGSSDSVYQARQRLFATAEQFNWPVGMSEFEAHDGTMVGPAAPDWMANLFPGLKLSRYDFRRMRSTSQLLADGGSESEMLFDGAPYAVYINGRTEADGTARYSLGVDLFNALEGGEAARKLEQGRIPLLTYSGQIVNSQWVDRSVSYKLAHEVAYDVFLKRNFLYRLLRALGEKRRPDFEPYKGMFDTSTPEPSDDETPPDQETPAPADTGNAP